MLTMNSWNFSTAQCFVKRQRGLCWTFDTMPLTLPLLYMGLVDCCPFHATQLPSEPDTPRKLGSESASLLAKTFPTKMKIMDWVTRSNSTSASSGSSSPRSEDNSIFSRCDSTRSKSSTQSYDWDKEEGGYIPYRYQAAYRRRWKREAREQKAAKERERLEKRAERYAPIEQKKADFKAQIEAHKAQIGR